MADCLTTACSGRCCAPPLKASVRRTRGLAYGRNVMEPKELRVLKQHMEWADALIWKAVLGTPAAV